MPEMRYEQILNKDFKPVPAVVVDTDAATAAKYGVFFVAERPYEVMAIAESHKTAGSDAGSVTLNIEKLTSGTALDAGDSICATAFDLKGTADTPVVKRGSDLTKANKQLLEGDRLALEDTGTLTAVNHVCVTVYLKPLGKGDYR